MRILYRRTCNYSDACFIAMNLIPDMLVSTVVFFLIPVDSIIFQNYNEASPLPPCQRLSCMVSFHKETNLESISKLLRHVGWKSLPDFFMQIGIYRVSPILAMKGIHVYVWFTWIEHHISIHVFLDICEYM